jgi:host factor-I protein
MELRAMKRYVHLICNPDKRSKNNIIVALFTTLEPLLRAHAASLLHIPLRSSETRNQFAGTIEGPIAWTSNMAALPDVQEDFLQILLNDKTAVNVFLVNGIRLSGQLAAFDQFAVLLESGSGSQLVFKHAISTVMPVNGKSPAREPTEVPVSGDKSNHLRGRVR